MTDVEYLVEVGRRLRAARVLAGVSQDELAKRASLSRVTLGSVERGEHPAGVLTYRKLAAAVGVRTGWLLDDKAPALGMGADREEGLPS